MRRWTGHFAWLSVYLSLVLAAPGAAHEPGFSRTQVEEVRSFQPYDGFQLAPLAHTDQVNIRLNRLAGRIKRHVHPHTDHFLYIITGQIELTVGDDTSVIGAGEFVSIPHGFPHAMQRLGESETLFLDVAAPPDIGDVIWQE